jgi:F0F1-type ATP synthase assembly protein I
MVGFEMVDDRTQRRRQRTRSIAQAYRDSHEVMSAALAVAVCVGGGYWLDQRYGLKPVLMVCGLAVGCLMAVASLRRLLIRLDKQSQDRKSGK